MSGKVKSPAARRASKLKGVLTGLQTLLVDSNVLQSAVPETDDFAARETSFRVTETQFKDAVDAMRSWATAIITMEQATNKFTRAMAAMGNHAMVGENAAGSVALLVNGLTKLQGAHTKLRMEVGEYLQKPLENCLAGEIHRSRELMEQYIVARDCYRLASAHMAKIEQKEKAGQSVKEHGKVKTVLDEAQTEYNTVRSEIVSTFGLVEGTRRHFTEQTVKDFAEGLLPNSTILPAPFSLFTAPTGSSLLQSSSASSSYSYSSSSSSSSSSTSSSSSSSIPPSSPTAHDQPQTKNEAPAVQLGGTVNSSEVRSELEAVLQAKENALCLDCNAPDPRWALKNLGGWVCIACSGVHRALGVGISTVASATMDKWELTHLEIFKRNNNLSINLELEHCVPETFYKPCAGSSSAIRQKFITAKYKDRAFTRENNPTCTAPCPPVFDPSASLVRRASSAASVETQGMLNIKLIEGRNLLNMDVLSESDPLCVFSHGTRSVTSTHVQDSNNPKWKNEMLNLCIGDLSQPLRLQVWDLDLGGRREAMGNGLIDLTRLKDGVPSDVWIPLDTQGEIRAEFLYSALDH